MNMHARLETAITAKRSIKGRLSVFNRAKFAALLTLTGCLASAFTSFAANPYLVRTFEKDGRQIDEIIVPGRPPAIKAQVVAVPTPNVAAGINTLNNVPAFTWCYGCSATSAGMMMGYYDNYGHTNMYGGPANGGICPMNNETYWGHTAWPSVTCGECPLVATHIGKDDRAARGHVEDYWIDYGNVGPDPYLTNGWTEHTQGDCTADFMGTSQSKFGSSDGATTFYMYTDGSPLYDFTGFEPAHRDGCHGMKLFVNSRGYTVITNFSQYIYGYNGNTQGFTYANFKAEIDAGRPVMIQVSGHSMVGYGYNDAGSTIYIHDTWDNSNHQMTWGGSYSGLQHYGVTVLSIQAAPSGVDIIPSSLAYSAFVGEGNPASQTFTVTNIGLMAFDFTNTVSYSPGANGWFTPSATTGHLAAAGALTVTGAVDITGLNAGMYYATNTITATNAANSPQLMVVTLHVLNPIELVPSSLMYVSDHGGTNPARQTFTVTNIGMTAFNFTNTVSYSPGANGWFTPSMTTGHVAVAGALAVTGSVNIAGLPSGRYFVTNTFTAPEVSSPQTMVVTLSVQDSARLWVSPTSLANAATEGHGGVYDEIKVANTGAPPHGTMTYTVTTPDTWLSVNPPSGWVVDNTNTVTVEYDATALTAGRYTGRVDVVAMGEGVGSQAVAVVLQVNNMPGVAWDAGSRVWTNEVILGNSLTGTSLAVWNNGRAPVGPMSYQAYVVNDPFGWVSVSNASGISTGNQKVVTINYVTTGLVAGVYTAQLMMEGWDATTGEAATNGPLNMWLQLTVAGSLPELKTDVANLSLTVLENHTGTNGFRLWNEGRDPRGGMRYTVTPNASWITANPTTGVVTNNENSVQVVWGTTGTTLPPGVYQSNLVVDAWDAQAGARAIGAPLLMPLTLTVTPRTPVNLELPMVVGTMLIGQTVTVDDGIWQNQGRLTFSYQWERASDKSGGGREVLSGATGVNYMITEADRGKYMRVGVTATDPEPFPKSSTTYSAWGIRAKVKALRADWNGDGITDLWFYDSVNGIWRVNFGTDNSASGIWPGLGPNMDAVPGDYNGDGYEDLAVYDRAHGMWYVLFLPSYATSSGSLMGGTIYEAQGIPVPEDYDGDGITDVAFYWQGYWVVLYSTLGTIGVVEPFNEVPGTPVTGDWDGDGIMEMGVYANGVWTLRMGDGTVVLHNFGGGASVLPAPGDYDGDGATDLGVHDFNLIKWSWVSSWTGTTNSESFGPFGGWPRQGYYDHDAKEDFAHITQYNVDFVVWFVKRTAEPASFPYPYHGQSYQQSTDRWRVSW